MTQELMDVEQRILEEIADNEFTRNNIARTYALCIESSEEIDFEKVNRAIIARWTLISLNYIKCEAWKLLKELQRTPVKENLKARRSGEKGEEEIKKLISKMNLAPNSEDALIRYTTEIYNGFNQKGLMPTKDPRTRVAIAAYLACDGKACVAVPKIIKLGHRFSIKEIQNARIKLNIPRGTAHQKLDSLCHVCQVSGKGIIAIAHEYVSLLDGPGFRPTAIAAAALYTANAESQSPMPYLTEQGLSRVTGITIPTIADLHGYIMHRIRRGEKTGKEK